MQNFVEFHSIESETELSEEFGIKQNSRNSSIYTEESKKERKIIVSSQTKILTDDVYVHYITNKTQQFIRTK